MRELPKSLEWLHKARREGKRPDAWVFLYSSENPGADFRCLVGLDVILLPEGGHPTWPLLKAVAPFASRLAYWARERSQGAEIYSRAYPKDPYQYDQDHAEMAEGVTDEKIAAFHAKWFPEWAHPGLWRWDVVMRPFSGHENKEFGLWLR